MSHRKFEQPRHGSLGFLPRKRTKKHHGKIRKFPKDDASEKCHLTGFMGYKAGMTHVIRLLERPGSKFNKKEVLEPATILECPPMMPVGIVGYVITPHGLRALTTVWGSHLSANCLRRFYKNWYRSKQKAFSRYEKKYKEHKETVFTKELERIRDNCSVLRIIAHTQIEKLNLRQKKDHIMEIQVNGGTMAEKVKFATDLLEKPLTIDSVFALSEMIDTCAATKGHGFEGTTTRWGTKKLPRKTNKGLRKVACVGAWHPQNMRYTVARAGQHGYHHRTEINKKIIRIFNAKNIAESGTTENDATKKSITPLGGFPHFGVIKNDFIMIKGCCPGVKKRPITLRKSLFPKTARFAQEPANIKWIDTSSKWGHGRFQTVNEKQKFLGPLKKDIQLMAEQQQKAAQAKKAAEKKKQTKKPEQSKEEKKEKPKKEQPKKEQPKKEETKKEETDKKQ